MGFRPTINKTFHLDKLSPKVMLLMIGIWLLYYTVDGQRQVLRQSKVYFGVAITVEVQGRHRLPVIKNTWAEVARLDQLLSPFTFDSSYKQLERGQIKELRSSDAVKFGTALKALTLDLQPLWAGALQINTQDQTIALGSIRPDRSYANWALAYAMEVSTHELAAADCKHWKIRVSYDPELEMALRATSTPATEQLRTTMVGKMKVLELSDRNKKSQWLPKFLP